MQAKRKVQRRMPPPSRAVLSSHLRVPDQGPEPHRGVRSDGYLQCVRACPHHPPARGGEGDREGSADRQHSTEQLHCT